MAWSAHAVEEKEGVGCEWERGESSMKSALTDSVLSCGAVQSTAFVTHYLTHYCAGEGFIYFMLGYVMLQVVLACAAGCACLCCRLCLLVLH